MHVFTVYIFPSEKMRRDYFKIMWGCIFIIMIISVRFIILFSYHVFATVTHYNVCVMQWQCSGLMFCCKYSIPRGCSHICGEALALWNLQWVVVTDSAFDLPSLTPLSVAG